MTKELYLIVLWQNSRYKQEEILKDIQQNLKISECIEIEWSKENVASNFTRFYGTKLPNRSFKEKECGRGSFLLITVWDENPAYDFIETSRGFEKVNKNIFELKSKYRAWTNGGHKIHTTNSPEETNHDITLLLGSDYEDYIKTAPENWNGKIRTLKRDLTGCCGWNSLEEFFYTLNATLNYVVLRNYEILPQKFNSELHGDIDILAENYQDVSFLCNAKPVFKQKYRVQNKVKIAGQDVLFDFRYLGDNYYCKEFEENILKNRVLNENGIYIPNNENAFYSLIYHGLIHKKKVAPDYYDKVKTSFEALDLDKTYNLDNYKSDFDLYLRLLDKYMAKMDYYFTKPVDLSVYYNERYMNTDKIISYLENAYEIKDLQPYLTGVLSSRSGYRYFTGNFRGQNLFIKWGGLGNSAKSEYEFSKKLYAKNQENFVKPVLYNMQKNFSFIAFEYLDGIMLDSIKENSKEHKETTLNILPQLENIAKTLISEKIIHRDIRPSNLMLTKDNKIKLIDMQFCMNANKPKEEKSFFKNPEFLAGLGIKYKPSKFTWDDMYSIKKLLKEYGQKSEFIEKNVGKYKIKSYLIPIIYYINILKKVPAFIIRKIEKLF